MLASGPPIGRACHGAEGEAKRGRAPVRPMTMFRVMIAAFLLLAPVAAAAAPRVAFVVGNSTYDHAPPLPNPSNDAALVARTLEGLGFEVDRHTNLSRWEIAAELSDFLKETEDAELTLFYFAGHGMQFEGRNYLLGTDARLRSELDIQAEALGLDQVTRFLRQNSRAALIFIDACRDNPVATDFYRRTSETTRAQAPQGLAKPTERFDGAMVTFSASPGQVAYDGRGAYSPFAEALARHLPTPNIEILTLMKRVIGDVRKETGDRQVPMVSNDLSREIYLLEQAALPAAPVAAAPAPVVAAPAPAPVVAAAPKPEPEPEPVKSELDLAFEAASSMGTERGWALFMNRFPQSTYQDEALKGWERAILVDNPDLDETVRAFEARLSVGPEEYRKIQAALSDAGFDPGPIDGVMGTNSRRALRSYQAAQDLTITGIVTIETAERLGLRIGPQGLVQVPAYSSRLAKLTRPEDIETLELDPRLRAAGKALRGLRYVYGHHDGRLYFVVLLPRPYSFSLPQAQNMAKAAGGHLATITSREENDFIYDLSKHDKRFWITCTAICTETFGPSFGLYQPDGSPEPRGGWRWVTDEPLSFTNWSQGEPTNHNNKEYFASFMKYRGKLGKVFHDKVWGDLPASSASIVIEID